MMTAPMDSRNENAPAGWSPAKGEKINESQDYGKPAAPVSATIQAGTLEVHPANLAVLPEMSPEVYAKLREDIAGLGLRHPILMYQGRILDGKCRYQACLELGIEPWLEDWQGGSAIVEFLLSENVYRRHLSPAEMEATARRALEWHRESARKRAEGRRNG